jgi:hypothetical protein
MKNRLSFLLILTLFLVTRHVDSNAQWVVGFHDSSIPFISGGYEFKEKIKVEVRPSINMLFEFMMLEGIGTYDIMESDNYEFYGGVGGRIGESLYGLVVPVGINLYPFQDKSFGFHMEMAPILGEEFLLRGSWGIRYRFGE